MSERRCGLCRWWFCDDPGDIDPRGRQWGACTLPKPSLPICRKLLEWPTAEDEGRGCQRFALIAETTDAKKPPDSEEPGG